MTLTITEIIHVLNLIKDSGYSDEKLIDGNDPHFAISNIFVNESGEVLFEVDEIE